MPGPPDGYSSPSQRKGLRVYTILHPSTCAPAAPLARTLFLSSRIARSWICDAVAPASPKAVVRVSFPHFLLAFSLPVSRVWAHVSTLRRLFACSSYLFVGRSSSSFSGDPSSAYPPPLSLRARGSAMVEDDGGGPGREGVVEQCRAAVDLNTSGREQRMGGSLPSGSRVRKPPAA